MTREYEDAYRTPGWFGDAPHPLLERFLARLPREARVLDIGSGQGRHALPLARAGCRVTGLDTARSATEQLAAAAAAEGLDVDAVQGDVFAHAPDDPYDGVLCCGLLQMLPATRVWPLAERLAGWVRPGGVLGLVAWTTDDPACAAGPAPPWRRVGPRAWHDPAGDRHRFFLHPDEVLGLFPGWEVLHHREGPGAPHRHGDGPEERHGEVEALLARPRHRLVDAWTRLGG